MRAVVDHSLTFGSIRKIYILKKKYMNRSRVFQISSLLNSRNQSIWFTKWVSFINVIFVNLRSEKSIGIVHAFSDILFKKNQVLVAG